MYGIIRTLLHDRLSWGRLRRISLMVAMVLILSCRPEVFLLIGGLRIPLALNFRLICAGQRLPVRGHQR